MLLWFAERALGATGRIDPMRKNRFSLQSFPAKGIGSIAEKSGVATAISGAFARSSLSFRFDGQEGFGKFEELFEQSGDGAGF